MKKVLFILILVLLVAGLTAQEENKIIIKVEEAFYISDYNLFITHCYIDEILSQVWITPKTSEATANILNGYYVVYKLNGQYYIDKSDIQNIIPVTMTKEEYDEYIKRYTQKDI